MFLRPITLGAHLEPCTHQGFLGVEDRTLSEGAISSNTVPARVKAVRLAWPPDTILQTLSARPPQILQTSSGESPPSDVAPAAATDLAALARAFPLPWSAYVKLLSARSDEARRFYETEALRNDWTVKQLDRQINSLYYERTALSRNKAAMLGHARESVDEDVVTPEEAIRDPFVLEFFELGDDFAFIARQRRLRLDDNWFRVDMVLFNRRLRCLVLIDLKLGKFSYQDAGQMTLYLNNAKEHWVKPGENPPAGIILCSDKGTDEAATPSKASATLCSQPSTVSPCRTRNS